MNKEIKWLRDLYLEDLGKTVCYDGHNKRPRVRHIGNWERIKTIITEGQEQVILPLADNDERDVWVWSDLHFGHKNIIRFSERPFDDTEQMNEHLIANFNEYVKPNDISYWVGDIAFGGDTFANNILDRCNGYKILIVGNHDFHKRHLRNLKFDEVHLLGHIQIEDVDLVMTHYPMENLPLPYINVHGHLHAGGGSHDAMDTLQHINVNCEFHNYRPINLNELMTMAKTRKNSMEI